MSIELDNIFDKYRLPSYLNYIPLFFYFPLGSCLAVIRVFIGIQAFLVSIIFSKLPTFRIYLLRVMCCVLGFITSVECFENYDKKAKVLVSNHVTNFDHLAVNLIKPVTVPSVWDLPPYLNWILGYTDFAAVEGRLALIRNVQNFMKKSTLPVLIFPEGATTNNSKGLLKFSTWPFLLTQSVQPLALKVHRPSLLKIAPSVLGSRWWSDMLWFLFVPYTVFRIRFLPVVVKSELETEENFCNKVQMLICKELGLEATNYTSSDKVEYAKQFLKICAD